MAEDEPLSATRIKDILSEQGYLVTQLSEPCITSDECDVYLDRHITANTLGHIPIAKIRDYLATSFREIDIENTGIENAEIFKITASKKVVAVGLLGTFTIEPETKTKKKGWLLLLGDDIANEKSPVGFYFIPAPVQIEVSHSSVNDHHLPFREFC
jgi:hypothetical protein